MAKSSTYGPRADESTITAWVVSLMGKSSFPDRWPQTWISGTGAAKAGYQCFSVIIWSENDHLQVESDILPEAQCESISGPTAAEHGNQYSSHQFDMKMTTSRQMAKGFPDRIRQMAKSSTSGPRAAESIITSVVVNLIGKSSCPDRWPKCEFLVLEPPRLEINAFSCQLGGKMSISKQMAKGLTSSPRAAVSIFNTSVVNLIGRWSKCC